MNQWLCCIISIICIFLTRSPAKTKINGFFFELIHRDSLLSPFYNSSLSQFEFFKRDALYSLDRVNHIHSTMHTGTKYMASVLIPNGGDYLMKVYVGSLLYQAYVVPDTASDLIWIQCFPCNECYHQDERPFYPNTSSSYDILQYDTVFCEAIPTKQRGTSNRCEYYFSYEEGSYTLGIMSNETFYINSTDDEVVSLPITFGCGHENRGTFTSRVQGIVGLGGGLLSLVSQMGIQVEKIFSYCLLPRRATGTSKIKFGLGAKISREGAFSTPLVANNPAIYYYLTLENISVGEKTTKTSQSQGNIIIDCGTTLTILNPSIYNDLEEIVKDAVGFAPKPDPSEKFSLCFGSNSVSRIKRLKMVFHFFGGRLRLKTINTFIMFPDLICMLIVSGDGISIFGNMAQVNFHIEYDLVQNQVSFMPSNCSTL